MADRSIFVRVPATVGNFAGALNCAALALDAPLNVKVTPRRDGRVGIRYFGEHGERVPRGRTNLVVRALETALHFRGLEFTGADFEIYSSVPVAVGLGSSTAAVLAGLIAAERLFRLQIDEKNLFDLAAIYESRGDNLRAAWFGGFVACPEEGPSLTYQRTPVPENFVLSVVVPETLLKSVAGTVNPVPPDSRPLRKGSPVHFVHARALAKFFAEPISGDSPGLVAPSEAVAEKVVPGLEEALKVRAPGLLAAFVCGSGPAVGILTQEDPAEAVRAVQESFARQGVRSSAVEFRASNAGAGEWNATPAGIGLPAARTNPPAARKFSLIPV